MALDAPGAIAPVPLSPGITGILSRIVPHRLASRATVRYDCGMPFIRTEHASNAQWHWVPGPVRGTGTQDEEPDDGDDDAEE